MSFYEILYGAVKSTKWEENQKRVARFLEPFEIVPFDDSATVFYADIRSQTEARGTPVSPNDLIIAATVLSQNGVLVTNNTKALQRIQELMGIKSMKALRESGRGTISFFRNSRGVIPSTKEPSISSVLLCPRYGRWS